MEQVNEIWRWVLAAAIGGGLTGAMVLAAVAWFARKRIEHWFARGLARERARHETGMQERKLQHERELEAYRTSLIALAESTKASQEVRKSAALMVAQKEFDALNETHVAVAGFSAQVVGQLRGTDRLTVEVLQSMVDRSNRVGNAVQHLSLFIDAAQCTPIYAFNARLTQLRNHALDRDWKIVRVPSEEEWTEIVGMEFVALNTLASQISRIRLMQ